MKKRIIKNSIITLLIALALTLSFSCTVTIMDTSSLPDTQKEEDASNNSSSNKDGSITPEKPNKENGQGGNEGNGNSDTEGSNQGGGESTTPGGESGGTGGSGSAEGGSEGEGNTEGDGSSDKPTIDENIPSSNPNSDQYIPPSENDINNGIKPYPDAITADNIQKLKLHPDILNDKYMYIMVRFMGNGSGWKKEDNIYPRGFVLGFNDNGENKDHFVNGFVLDENKIPEPIPRRGYTNETGFALDENGNYMITKFYCGFEGMKTPIYQNTDIKFQFSNFVIWDNLDGGLLGGGFDHTAFVRYPEQDPLTIIIPMKDYDSTLYNNVAYVTIYFELQGNVSTYKAVFDGFEPKGKVRKMLEK